MNASVGKKQFIAELDEIIGWGTIAAPFIVALAFFPLNYDFFGLPKLSALYIGTLFLLYFQARRWLAEGCIEVPSSPALLPVAVLLLVAVVSVAMSATPLASITGRFNRYNSLPGLISYAIVFWFALKYAAHKRVFIERFETLFIPVVFIVTIYGLLEILGLDVLSMKGTHGVRVSSTLGNPVFFGAFLAITLPILLSKAVMFSEKTASAVRTRGVAAALLLFGLAMLFTSLSRGAWMGVAAGFAAVVYFWARSGQKPMRVVVLWTLLLVGAFLAGVGIVSMLAGSDIGGIVDAAGSSSSLASRIEIWKTSLLMIGDKPLFGFGLDQTKDWFNLYMTEGLAGLENTLHGRAHNIFLQMGLDGGIPLLFANLWLFLFVVLKGMRHLRSHPDDYVVAGLLGSLLGFFAQGLTGIATVDQELFVWFVMGSIVGLASHGRQREVKLRLSSGKPQVVAVSALAVIGLAAILFPLGAEARYLIASEEAKLTLSSGALEHARQAGKYLVAQPYYEANLARIYLTFGAELEDPRYAREAAEIVEHALKYAPNASELRLVRGTAYLAIAEFTREEADIEKAAESLQKAHELTPLMLSINEDLLELYILKGDYRAVLETADFVGSFKNNNVRSMVARVVALEALNRGAEAKQLYKEATKLDPNASRIKGWLVELKPGSAAGTKEAASKD
ncbi:MAG: O-antigen ligase family protein [Actinomycetota bacterium]|nr:O-antigen ligase family protein [Actinomycetota bacterium]